MKVYNFVWFVILLFTVNCITVSRDTLEELGFILKQYKRKIFHSYETKDSSNKQDTDRNVDKQHEYIDQKGRFCADKCRLVYHECLVEKKDMYNRMCTKTYVKCYPNCFFHDKEKVVVNDLSLCTDSCIKSFDQCMFASSKTEVILCLRKRHECRRTCPGSIVKRGCEEDCDGEYTQCEHVVLHIEDMFTCVTNKAVCRSQCWHTRRSVQVNVDTRGGVYKSMLTHSGEPSNLGAQGQMHLGVLPQWYPYPIFDPSNIKNDGLKGILFTVPFWMKNKKSNTNIWHAYTVFRNI